MMMENLDLRRWNIVHVQPAPVYKYVDLEFPACMKQKIVDLFTTVH